MTARKKPEPCPFCEAVPDVFEWAARWGVCCENRRCLVNPGTSRLYATRYAAIRAWNRRAK